MQWFKDLRIKMKLMTAFLLVLALTAILGIFATIELTRISAMTGDMANNALPGVRNISRINALVGSFRRAELLMAISDDDAGVRKYIDRNRETLEKLKTARSEYEKLIDNDTERKTYAEFSAAWESYLKEDPKIVELSIQHKVAEASRLIRGDSSKYFNQAIKALDANEDFQTKQALEKGQRCFAVNTSARVWIVIALVACITLGLILAVVIAGLITGPIQELEEKAARVATGDLTVEVSRCSRDEVGDLAGSFGRLTESLRTTIRKVNETSTLVASASTQLQATSEQIATGAEELANQSQGVATSSEEMSATSNDIARNCQAVALSSRQANDAAQSGADVVALTVEVMTRIAERVNGTARSVESLGARSDQIGAIVSTIEDIADQTNLLALNAAIEAARAGEQGRGFAVVADEVRALAERTTKATREIGAMIKAIQSETHDAVVAMEKGVRDVQQGTEEAAKSGSALKEILEQINSVTMQVNQIATAAEEQTATISEITSNIHQISDVVQQTAQGSQESAAAAAQLAGLSNDLRAMVGQFRFV